jgi:hypothetical protein
VVAGAFTYAPRGHRTAVAISVTAGFLVLFAALVWWRTAALLQMFGGPLHLS